MADNTNSNYQDQFFKEKHKEEMKYQVITFAMMIAFTIIAFGLVVGDFSKYLVVPIILVLAVVQVLFQLYYFMHLNQKGHEMPSLMIFSGVFAAVLTILALTTITWI
ncbi:cytochrome c oxidase subunit 4 [Salinibacillus kushneri]|uniref:Cytochrome c oxidase subunit 4 n=1 Tax=Salinibacillus kushneri TaxID=237682 RepID=A0A1I0HSM6_9BACI|nr:cytochrome c oxidase subunit IVB [Salinibacillus kushneri]SET86162.1 cytochrome c oxidase subunit 4 [Salinibacillus kushneri]